MSLSRVVVLSSHSLYTEGVLSRLKAHSNALELHVVDADQTDALDQIIAIQPTAVIVDASDKNVNAHCPLGRLLRDLPDVRIIRLDPINKGFQLVTSEQHEAEEVQELLTILKSGTEANEG
jgi:DNA-binding NarL/FixJ family response regulator